jgi:hypothetical protein
LSQDESFCYCAAQVAKTLTSYTTEVGDYSVAVAIIVSVYANEPRHCKRDFEVPEEIRLNRTFLKDVDDTSFGVKTFV